LGNRK